MLWLSVLCPAVGYSKITGFQQFIIGERVCAIIQNTGFHPLPMLGMIGRNGVLVFIFHKLALICGGLYIYLAVTKHILTG